jgi:hypothetical protein
MSTSLGLTALSRSSAWPWTGLRMGQGAVAEDALFCGLFWPMDVTRRWIELVMRALTTRPRPCSACAAARPRWR